ncbi:Smr/MutS family protein [Xanthobacter sp. TB0139]|uniref:Smr/MutS family protein n=1 Tax=Xanthobacter sp. TB0139 TaxID=3459178 RepID=UPI0040396B7F
MSRRSRKRELKAEERALWAHVVQHITPLHPRTETAPASPPAPPPAEQPSTPEPPASQKAGPSSASRKRPPAPPAPPPLTTLEPKARRRLGRGAEVDARLDLHGLTQTAAHYRLRMFLMDAQASGHSVVLVITGKGGGDRLAQERESARQMAAVFGEERGVLRRAVPHWLAAPDLRGVVLGFESAGRRHGGEGALYVRIRRRR